MNKKIAKKITPIVMVTMLTQMGLPLVHTHAQTISSNVKKDVLVVYKNQDGKNAVLRESNKVKHQFSSVSAVSVTVDQNDISKLKRNPNIAHVEDNITLKLQDVPAKFVKTQSATVAKTQSTQWDMQTVQAPQAWQQGLTGKGVKVGVIDSGIAPHSDLKIAGGVSEVSYTNSYADDNGHGTHVAGTIGATGNGLVKGVAPDVQLYAIKVMDKTGSGDLQSIVAGIDWAIQNKMDIINLSLGTDTDSPLLHDMIDKAYNNGILVVVSAGNSGNAQGTGDTMTYPAKYSSSISVASVDQNLGRSYFSSTGSELEVSAPGSNIESTYLNNGYAFASGTSMASPHIAGLLALLKQKYPTMTNVQLRSVLDKSTQDLGVVGKDSLYGFGLAKYPLVQAPVNPTTPTVTTPVPGMSHWQFQNMIDTANSLLHLADAYKTDWSISEAQKYLNLIPASAEKTALQNRLNAIKSVEIPQSLLNQIETDISLAKAFRSETYKRKAQSLINTLPSSVEKDYLNKLLHLFR